MSHEGQTQSRTVDTKPPTSCQDLWRGRSGLRWTLVARQVCRVVMMVALAASWGTPTAGAQELPAGAAVAPRPLELLIEHRDELGLTGPQLERLDRIRARLTRANEPLVRRMLNLRREWQQQRLVSRPNAARLARIRAAAEPVHARIQANNRTAMQAVNRLLTGPQRQRLRALVEARRQQGEPERSSTAAPDVAGQD